MSAEASDSPPPPGQQRAAGVLMVFGKAPEPGVVKTRMCPPLSPEQAAEFYENLLDDTLEASVGDARALGLTPIFFVHPPNAMGELAERMPEGFCVIEQCGDGLGARMAHAIAQGAAMGAERILVRGSDNPALSREHITACLDALERHDLVISPDRDGGYGLLGVRAPAPYLFGHAMSTGSVLEETLDCARAADLDVALIEPCFDLDTVADLADLDAWRHSVSDPHRCARTITWVDSMNLWPDPAHRSD